MPASEQPAAEVDIDVALVRRLLEEQHPDLASLELELVAFGWDNVMFRLGDELSVRLPRRQVAASLIEHEQRWLPVLAPRLPVPIPLPLRIGVPGAGFPWRWSVCPWLPGSMAATSADIDCAGLADDLADFIAPLHRAAPGDAPVNPVRGVPLLDRDVSTRTRLEQVHDLVDGPAVLALWEVACATPPWDRPPVWLHGDLHPANLLVEGGRLSAVIDFGDITAGDPATDLAVAWMVLPVAERERFRDRLAVDDDTWSRARGWATSLGVAYVSSSADAPVITAIGRRTLQALLAEAG